MKLLRSNRSRAAARGGKLQEEGREAAGRGGGKRLLSVMIFRVPFMGSKSIVGAQLTGSITS